ncbi:hypothetical protein HG536_0C01060 [Torulaspora globosa]|uniref:Uncharacterized protein n=1 Tax=Torulaspora globosa TaxID=48254 RepID=A0A7G3ZEK3_9SACH|nr:uncharacterized protein HG536_0C01060 [Torulaspora globosa]QLL31939.1 hypothetical protein HG536_0C01060 [Torulaspora globosa]
MNTSSTEYRTEALKLILFAERTEWAAKHGKLNDQSKSLIDNGVNKKAIHTQMFKGSEFTRTRDAGTSAANAKRQPERHTGKTSPKKPLKSESKSDNVNPGKLQGRQRPRIDARETQSKSTNEVSNDRSEISFHLQPLKKVLNNSGAQLNSTGCDWRPASPSQTSLNPGKVDLIASAQQSTSLINTLLGGSSAYSLPEFGFMRLPDLLNLQKPHTDLLIGRSTSSRLIPGPYNPSSASYNYIPSVAATATEGRSIPPQPNSSYNNGYITSSNNYPSGTLQQESSQEQLNNAVCFEQGRTTFKAPVPIVKNQTLPKSKQSIQKNKSKQAFEPSKHENAQTKTALKPDRLGYRDKVRKKKLKSLKRMNTIAKKYKL